MKLTYVAPPPDLTPYLSAYYLFECDEEIFEDIERADIAQVRYFLSGAGTVIFPNGTSFDSAQVSVFGPRMCVSKIVVKGPMRTFGFGLLPAGWAAATKLPACDHVNKVIEAIDIFGASTLDLLDRLRGLSTVEEMAEEMNAVVRQFYARAEAVPHWFIRAVDQWLEAGISPELESLETATGLSRRQIERLTKQFYGAPPKLLVRKYRALRVANAIARGNQDWQDFIADAYYDQSHCIREIKEFVGITPGAVRGHVSPLTNKTFDRSNLMGDIATLSAQT
jgi:AraC-like DNA-binding protein